MDPSVPFSQPLPESGIDPCPCYAESRESCPVDAEPENSRSRDGVAKLIPAVVVAGVYGLALWQSWGLWPDSQVDFGRELYVPWRITLGEHLYKDIAYFNPPFSAYWNALWFQVLGVGLATLVRLNIVITAGIAWLIYQLVRVASDRFTATVCAAFFVGVFACGQSSPVANFNYITPYSHELTNGLALALLALWIFQRRDPAEPTRGVVMAAFVTGVAFLCKIEVFLALVSSLGVYFLLAAWSSGTSARETARLLGLALAAVVAAPIAAFILLCTVMSPDQALEGFLGPWASALNPRIASLAYYKWVLGTLDLSESLDKIRLWSLRYLLFLGPLLGLSFFFRAEGRNDWSGRGTRYLWPAILSAGLLLLLAYPMPPLVAEDSVRPLPLVLPLLVALNAFYLVRARRKGQDLEVAILRVVLCVFATTILFKMYLNAHFFHYGFVLIMPGTMVLITALLSWIPNRLKHLSGSGLLFRVVCLAVVFFVAQGVNEKTRGRFEKRVNPVGSGVDAFSGGIRAQYMSYAIEFLAEEMKPDETLVVLPEGIMVNYLIRRANPTPYINFMPPEMILFGHGPILHSLKRNAPDYIALVHKKTVLYGYPYFGRNYGQTIYRWVHENYHAIRRIGMAPFRDDTVFGIVILRRN